MEGILTCGDLSPMAKKLRRTMSIGRDSSVAFPRIRWAAAGNNIRCRGDRPVAHSNPTGDGGGRPAGRPYYLHRRPAPRRTWASDAYGYALSIV